MSDSTQPALSRRDLREKRRAETEALLASSQAEHAAKQLADHAKSESEAVKPSGTANSNDPKTASPSSKPAPEAKPAAATKPAQPTPPVVAKPPVTPKVTESKPAPQKTTPPKAAPVSTPAPAAKPVVAATPKLAPAAPKAPVSSPAKPVAQAPKRETVEKKEPAKAQPNLASKPVVATNEEAPAGERVSLRRARDREALRERRRLEEEVGALTTNVPTVEPADDPKPLTRRQLRLQSLAEQGQGEPVVKKPQNKPAAKPATSEDSPETTVMSVEEALAARRAHAPKAPEDSNLLGESDSEIDLEVLAHQREMAARAAIISRRAAERERLRIDNLKSGKDQVLSDPFTGALGNIREVEERIAKTGVQGPKTESVSLALDADGKLSDKLQHHSHAAKKPSGQPVKPAEKKPVAKVPVTPGHHAKPVAKPAVKPPVSKAVKTPVKPEASASDTSNKTEDINVDVPRIDAVNAHGLQPLDAQTHGVRRANNQLIAMIAALSVGGAALVAGIIMLVS